MNGLLPGGHAATRDPQIGPGRIEKCAGVFKSCPHMRYPGTDAISITICIFQWWFLVIATVDKAFSVEFTIWLFFSAYSDVRRLGQK